MQPYYDEGGITIYHGDCRDVLPSLGYAELVVTDPPYGTGGWRRHAAGQGHNPHGGLVRETWDDGATDWLELVRADAILTFWPPARTSGLLNVANSIGLVKHRALYMRKPDPKPLPGGRTRWSVEPIWCLSQEGFVLHGGDDLYECSTPRLGRDREAVGHPYQKPLAVMRWLVGKTEAGHILDPFMGSGTTLVAAKALGRTATGIELDERWCDATARRLSQQVLPLEVS